MSIIVSRSGKNATKLTKSRVASEDYLQGYIHDNPDSLPLDEYKEGLQLLILAREFPTGSGPIDALGVDQDGELYLIETKLYKNPDKRTVLAQVLDYGASLWKTYADPESFVTRLQECVSDHFGRGLRELLEETYGLSEEEAGEFLAAVRSNVSAGSFRFVVLMDRIEDRLKDLITFMNQNSRFDVFGVELEFFEFEDLEILIPRLFGAEVKKNVGGGSSSRRSWDEESFFADAEARLDPSELGAVRRLYAWATDAADRVDWGTGARRGSFNPKHDHIHQRSVFTVYSDGVLELHFDWLDDTEEGRRHADALGAALRRDLEALEVPEDYATQHVQVPVETWAGRTTELVEVLDNVLLGDVHIGQDG